MVFLIFSPLSDIYKNENLPTLWSFQLYSFIKSFPHLILFLYVKSDWKIMHSPTILNQKIKRFFQNLEFWSLVSTEFEFPGKPKISIPKKNHKSFWSDICRYLIFYFEKDSTCEISRIYSSTSSDSSSHFSITIIWFMSVV